MGVDGQEFVFVVVAGVFDFQTRLVCGDGFAGGDRVFDVDFHSDAVRVGYGRVIEVAAFEGADEVFGGFAGGVFGGGLYRGVGA